MHQNIIDNAEIMSKKTMAKQLPRKAAKNLEIMGEQIRLARLRRNLTMDLIAQRAQCSPITLGRIEKGNPTVAIGIYVRVLVALGLEDDILMIAKDDELGRAIQDANLPRRKRGTIK